MSRTWTFFTNHAHVLFCISQSPAARIRDLAAQVGITERATQGIVTDLEAAGYLTHDKVGRRNRYQLAPGKTMRHPIESHITVDDLVELLTANRTTNSGSHE